MKICGIYKITSPNGSIYIGQSIDIEKRFKLYKRMDCKGQKRLYRSFIKYGIDNHIFDIIHICEYVELNKLEKYYVDLYGTFNSSIGLNIRDGGGSLGKLSEETKNKIKAIKKSQSNEISQRMRGVGNHRYGKNISEQHRKIISECVKKYNTLEEREIKRKRFSGVNNPSYGGLSDLHKEKLRQINLGKKCTEETKIKSRISALNKAKIVLQFDLNGNLINEFIGIKFASRQLNINYQNIQNCCHNRIRKTNGYVFKFKIQ